MAINAVSSTGKILRASSSGWMSVALPQDPDAIDPAEPATASEIVYNSLTWTLSESATVGQYVTGDWWVYDPGGGITVQSVTPAPNAGVNGSMVNPVSGGQQGFHSSADGYNAELGVTFPLTLNGGDVLLSSVNADEDIQWDGTSIATSTHSFIREVGVLTCVSSIPAADAFRPGYCDRTQTEYTESQIVDANIPSADTTGVTAPSAGAFSTAAERFARGVSRPWMVFVDDWQGRESHPQLHQYNYLREIGSFLSELCCFVCSDYENKDGAIRGLIQLGIDMYYSGLNGDADGDYWVAPVIMAGHFLGDNTMRDCFLGSSMQCTPRDYADFYLMSDMTATTESAHVTPGETYSGHLVGFRNNLGVNREYEHLRPDEWGMASAGANEAWKDDVYRTGIDSHTVVGMALAAQLCGLQGEWGHDATFAYVQRWMIDADIAAEREILDTYYPGGLDYAPTSAMKSSGNAFVDSMFAAHWTEYVWPE